MTRSAPPGVTADDVLVYAKRLINDFGWQRLAWSVHGPAPRCIRSAISGAAQDLEAMSTVAHTDALRRVSEAIYGRGSVGGIMEFEFRKRTTTEAVVALLQKAIEMGPSDREVRARELWPT